MFHRVKSETIEPAKAPDSTSENEDKQPDVQEDDAQLVEAQDDVKEEVFEETASEPQTESEPQSVTENEPEIEKDTQTMTDTQTPETQETPSTQTTAYQPTAAPAGGYPGAYPGYAASASASQTTSEPAGDRRLTIGAGITMSGEIEACDYLLVEGTVEAALKGASVLEIAESGIFYGTVEIENAEIAGRFEGDITATGRLTLREGATVTGSIAYQELEIEAGAVIDGKLTPLQAVQAAGNRPSATKKAAPAPTAKVKEAATEAAPAPANNDGGLFTKAAAVAE